MRQSKRILILGIGTAQIDAINLLKDQGHYVIGTSYENEGITKTKVDEFSQINIIDKEKTLAFAKEKKVDMVYSIGSDLAMPTIGYVNQQLGLPSFVSEENADIMQNKPLFRSFLNSNGLGTIKYQKALNLSDLFEWDCFPSMIKPTDSQGQRGVSKVENRDELESKFSNSKSYSRTGTVIIEQFIDGKEISVNGYMVNGELVYSFFSDRRVLDGFSGGLVKGHDFPSAIPEKHELRAKQMIKEIAVKLNYFNGPLYFQMMYNDNDIFIVEGSPRLDGCHLWRLIYTRYHINLMELVFDHLLGKHLDIIPVVEPKNLKHSIDFFTEKPGKTFNSIDYSESFKKSNYIEFYYSDGQIIRPVNGLMEKIGYCMYSGEL